MPSIKPRFPSIWQAILIAIGFWVVQFAVGIIVGIPAFLIGLAVLDDMVTHVLSTIGSALLTILFVFGLLILLSKLTRLDLRELFQKPKHVSVSLCFSLLLFTLGSIILVSEINNITMHFFPMPEFLKRIMHQMYREPVSAFVTVCIMAPLVEEALFRGVIIQGFQTRYSVKKTIIVSGIIFSFVHINPYQFMVAFVMGIAFAYIYIQTKSLWLVIACHFFNNFLAWLFASEFAPFQMRGFSGAISEGFQPIWFSALGIVLMASGGFLLFKQLGRPESTPIEDPEVAEVAEVAEETSPVRPLPSPEVPLTTPTPLPDLGATED